MKKLKAESLNRAESNLKVPWYVAEDMNYYGGGTRKTTFKVKYCTKCSHAWEYHRFKKDEIYKYEDFPSYGCQKVTCMDCL